MPDPLTHFAIAFALSSFIFRFKTAFLMGVLALLPDFDVLFFVHRSFTHSIILVALVFLPLIILKTNKLTLMSFFAIVSHVITDTFQAPTPILYPLISDSIHISINAGIIMDQGIKPYFSTTLKFVPTNFNQFSSFNAPLFAGTMVPIAAFLVLIPIIKSRVHSSKLSRHDGIVTIVLKSNEEVKSIVEEMKSKGVNKIIVINNPLSDGTLEIANNRDLALSLSQEGESKAIERTPLAFVMDAKSNIAGDLKKKSIIRNLRDKINLKVK